MEPIQLPSLSHFRNGNGWLGSIGPLRFQIETPLDKEGQEDKLPEEREKTASVVLWQGPYSRPYAQEFGRETFEVTQEGLSDLTGYLTRMAQKAQEDPFYSPQEVQDYYLAKKAEEAGAGPS